MYQSLKEADTATSHKLQSKYWEMKAKEHSAKSMHIGSVKRSKVNKQLKVAQTLELLVFGLVTHCLGHSHLKANLSSLTNLVYYCHSNILIHADLLMKDSPAFSESCTLLRDSI